mgnify:CR=1
MEYYCVAVSNVSFSLCLLVILQEQQVCFKERSGEQEMDWALLRMYLAYQAGWIGLNNALPLLYISVPGISVYMCR